MSYKISLEEKFELLCDTVNNWKAGVLKNREEVEERLSALEDDINGTVGLSARIDFIKGKVKALERWKSEVDALLSMKFETIRERIEALEDYQKGVLETMRYLMNVDKQGLSVEKRVKALEEALGCKN